MTELYRENKIILKNRKKVAKIGSYIVNGISKSAEKSYKRCHLLNSLKYLLFYEFDMIIEN